MCYSMTLLENDLTLSPYARFLKKHGLYSAALFYKNLNETLERRAARASRFSLETISLPCWEEGQIVPIAARNSLYQLSPEDDTHGYGLQYLPDGEPVFREDTFRKLYEKCENSVEQHIVDTVIHNCRAAQADISSFRFRHFGTHNVVDFDFVLCHGIGAYRQRIEKAMEQADPAGRMFEEGMLDVLEGVTDYLRRYRAHLEQQLEHTPDPWLRRVAEALKQVPMNPARSFFEAYVSAYMAMALAGNFEPGRLDHYLWPWYQADLAAGKITSEEAFRLIRAMFEDIDAAQGHPGVTHVTIGGTNADGSPSYNELTLLCVRAIAGLRTPNVTLRVRKDMPEDLWAAALQNLGNGCSHPALVNEDLFLSKLTEDYAVPYADAVQYVFGGCSELLIQGKTMCDSTWVQYNMLDIFENTLYNHFLTCDSFNEFYRRAKEDISVTLEDLQTQINNRQLALASNIPLLMKTLLADGCIENRKSFSAGGAVYNFDSTNLYAGTNALNSLYTLKQFYDGKLGPISREELLRALIKNFEGYEAIHAKCRNVTKFGNYDPELNALANDFMTHTFRKVMELRCWRGNAHYEGRYMPAVILWVDWISSGQHVGATPDGRFLGDATADCAGPMQGTDTEGPTSVMGAALALDQGNCAGTCVLNLRLDKANFRTPEATRKVRQLMQVYFARGGSQLQVNVVDPKTLQDAYDHPENHRDLIVRVGGFSDNFVLLDRCMQREILKRTEYSV